MIFFKSRYSFLKKHKNQNAAIIPQKAYNQSFNKLISKSLSLQIFPDIVKIIAYYQKNH